MCVGNFTHDFVEMCKARGGNFKSRGGDEVVSFLEEGYPIEKNESQVCTETVRHSNCHFLSKSRQCTVCAHYKTNLKAMYRNYSKGRASQPHKNTNIRFLKATQKSKRMKQMQRQLRRKHQRVLQLKKRVTLLTKKTSVVTDENLVSDIRMVIDVNHPEILKLPVNDFRRVFWEQQVLYMDTYYGLQLCITMTV